MFKSHKDFLDNCRLESRWYKCPICSKEVSAFAFTKHIKNEHNYSSLEEFYAENILSRPKCENPKCSNLVPNKIKQLSYGWNSYCCGDCNRSHTYQILWATSKDFRDARKEGVVNSTHKDIENMYVYIKSFGDQTRYKYGISSSVHRMDRLANVITHLEILVPRKHAIEIEIILDGIGEEYSSKEEAGFPPGLNGYSEVRSIDNLPIALEAVKLYLEQHKVEEIK